MKLVRYYFPFYFTKRFGMRRSGTLDLIQWWHGWGNPWKITRSSYQKDMNRSWERKLESLLQKVFNTVLTLSLKRLSQLVMNRKLKCEEKGIDKLASDLLLGFAWSFYSKMLDTTPFTVPTWISLRVQFISYLFSLGNS